MAEQDARREEGERKWAQLRARVGARGRIFLDPAGEAGAPGGLGERVIWRNRIGYAAVVVLVLNVAWAALRVEALAGVDGSAVQAIQIYAEHLLYAITVVGVAVAVYVATRWAP